MDKDYYVICKKPCPGCDGTGYTRLYAELYREFDAASNAERDRLKNELAGEENFGRRVGLLEEFDNAWWAKRGWSGGVRCWPPEEETCNDCEGRGAVREEVPLSEIARATMEYLLNERLKHAPDFLCEALNMGDGVYRP